MVPKTSFLVAGVILTCINGKAFVLRAVCTDRTNATSVNTLCRRIFHFHKQNEEVCAFTPLISPATSLFMVLAGMVLTGGSVSVQKSECAFCWLFITCVWCFLAGPGLVSTFVSPSPALERRLTVLIKAIIVGMHFSSVEVRGDRTSYDYFISKAEVISHIQQGCCKDEYIWSSLCGSIEIRLKPVLSNKSFVSKMAW